MSKLADAIELLSLGSVPQTSLLRVGGGVKAIDNRHGHMWEMVVRLGTRIVLPPVSDVDELHRARRHLCENIVEYAFGEFRTPLLELRSKLYENGDVENADRVSEILAMMFRS